jgi:4-azaleucine resistance transporter AzlC
VLYAIPLIDQLPQRRLSRAYVIAALTDENYSVLTTVPETERRRLAVGISAVNHLYWIAGTALGVALGAQATRWIPNLDFALPALFTILAIEQYIARRRWAPMVVGLGAYLIARTLVPSYALISALAIGLLVLLSIAIAAPPADQDGKLDWSGDANQ